MQFHNPGQQGENPSLTALFSRHPGLFVRFDVGFGLYSDWLCWATSAPDLPRIIVADPGFVGTAVR